MPGLTVRFARDTDTLLRNFFGATTERISTSGLIELAILYHKYTGDYMNLGKISTNEEHPEKKVVRVYVPKNSELNEIIREHKEIGINFGELIRDVVENGIEIGDNTKLIGSAEYYAKKIELKAIIRKSSGTKSSYFAIPSLGVKDDKKTTPAIEPVQDVKPESTKQSNVLDAGEEQDFSEPVTKPKRAKRISYLNQFAQSSFDEKN